MTQCDVINYLSFASFLIKLFFFNDWSKNIVKSIIKDNIFLRKILEWFTKFKLKCHFCFNSVSHCKIFRKKMSFAMNSTFKLTKLTSFIRLWQDFGKCNLNRPRKLTINLKMINKPNFIEYRFSVNGQNRKCLTIQWQKRPTLIKATNKRRMKIWRDKKPNSQRYKTFFSITISLSRVFDPGKP